jgi:hypothetical protein
MTNQQTYRRTSAYFLQDLPWDLGIGVWGFLGVWSLGFGVFGMGAWGFLEVWRLGFGIWSLVLGIWRLEFLP